VREILERTNEIDLLHPCYQDFEPARELDPYRRENFDLTFIAVQDCSHEDCALCRRDLEILKSPGLVIVGKSRYDPEVIEANKRYQARREKQLNHLKLMRLAMQAI
jgi:hypothetical protein